MNEPPSGVVATASVPVEGQTRVADQAGPPDAAPPKPPPRPVEEVIRDLELERRGMVDALQDLKLQARSTKERFLSPRT